MTPAELAKARIRALVARSSVVEDPTHAEDTRRWLLRLKPDADEGLRIAALGHDIERATHDRVRRADYEDYDDFKAAHARRSARILKPLLTQAGLQQCAIVRICTLVELHESGGTPESDLLMEADSLSFFTNNLSAYLGREGETEALRRCRWGILRLSERGRDLLAALRFTDPRVALIVSQALCARR